VRRVLEPEYSNNSASDSEPHLNIVIEHVFPFVDLDHSLLAVREEQREPSLISYESNILLENIRANSVSGDMTHSTTHQSRAKMVRSRTISRL